MANKPTKRRVPGGSGTTKRTGGQKPAGSHHRRPGDKDASPTSSRYTPPDRDPHNLPSPVWVPILMFSLLGAGMLLIILNYMDVFGDASNVRLIIGLGLILAGIMVATQYR